MNKLHILQTGTWMNPLKPRENPFYESGLVLYVARSVYTHGSLKAITSWGHLGGDYEIGRVVKLIADQTGRSLGPVEIVAIVDLTTMVRHLIKGLTYWHDLDRDIKHYVVK
jgi:hypothetical protein